MANLHAHGRALGNQEIFNSRCNPLMSGELREGKGLKSGPWPEAKLGQCVLAPNSAVKTRNLFETGEKLAPWSEKEDPQPCGSSAK